MSLRLMVETDRPLVARDSMTRYLLATIVAPEGAPRTRASVNLGLVLDRSGSMSGEKIRLARDAAVAALRRLGPGDSFSVVVYDQDIDVIAPLAPFSPDAVEAAARALLRVEGRGSTDLCGGWLRGCEQVALRPVAGGVNKVVLLTDGLANVGVTDHGEILGHARELRRRGIATTTIGVGEDFDEHLLGALADEGGGRFYYVARDEEIPNVIAREVGETLEVVVRAAELRIAPASVVTAVPIATYPTRREGGDWLVELGDLVSRQELEVPIRVSFGSHGVGADPGASVRLAVRLAGAGAAETTAEVVYTVVTGPEVGAQSRNRRVDRAVANAYAAMARREAGRLNRDGDVRAAARRLDACASRIAEYAAGDAELSGLADELRRDAAEHERRLDARDLKARYAAATYAVRSRDLSGGSRRRGGQP
jgi:Ca-activated chloride channel family protein